jgi:pimeloyl-ACP methyl ester carboxylesterase
MYRTASLEEYPRYSLAFIEFDDQGELWAPSQVDRALAHLERLNQNESGVALMIFAHGWNASAAPGQESDPDSALSRFKAILARLDRGIEEELPELELPIMGVYLGWRGRVSSVPLVRQASFYNRRGAAERIAGAAATEAIYRLLTALRENPASRSVLIGHSFGSLILERALAQAVISALLAAEAHELVFPADLVVLFNPAGSATRAKQLVDILARNRLKTYRYDRRGNRFERPLLVSLTSESDRATRVYFPAGMFFKAASKQFRNYGPEHCSPISNPPTPLVTSPSSTATKSRSVPNAAGPATRRRSRARATRTG